MQDIADTRILELETLDPCHSHENPDPDELKVPIRPVANARYRGAAPGVIMTRAVGVSDPCPTV